MPFVNVTEKTNTIVNTFQCGGFKLVINGVYLLKYSNIMYTVSFSYFCFIPYAMFLITIQLQFVLPDLINHTRLASLLQIKVIVILVTIDLYHITKRNLQ